jgi:hypothetical protein
MTLRPFDPERQLTILLRHRVRFVIIGGIGGRLFGSPSLTNDLDICYARDRKNLTALSSALLELHATLRGAPDGLPFRPDVPTLAAGNNFTFSTDAGNLDCLGTPAGSSGFQDLIAGATDMSIGKLTVPVAALEDLIRLKQASAHPKDLAEVEILAALKDEIERGGGHS